MAEGRDALARDDDGAAAGPVRRDGDGAAGGWRPLAVAGSAVQSGGAGDVPESGAFFFFFCSQPLSNPNPPYTHLHSHAEPTH